MLVAWAYGTYTWASNVTSLLVSSRLQDSVGVVQEKKVMRNTRGGHSPLQIACVLFSLGLFYFLGGSTF